MSLQFARIVLPVCSCGNYVGRFQHEIEFELVRRQIDNPGLKTDDRDVSEILNDLGIMRMCCRGAIIMSPVLRLMKVGPEFNIYSESRPINKTMKRYRIGQPNPQI